MATEFRTGVGRIVWGHPLESQIKTDQENDQPIIKDGQPVKQWVFGVAFPKADFNQNIWPYLQAEAAQGYPNGVPSNFAWKLKDGDGVDKKGKKYSDREGYEGCWILTVSTEAFAPDVFKMENGAFRKLEAKEIKCGDYIDLKLNVKVNVPQKSTHTPGLYINPMGINLVGYGKEIVRSSINAQETFGNVNYQLPPGATLMPQAPQGMPGPAAAPGAPMSAPPGGLQYQQAAYGAPTAPPQQPLPPPARDFVQNAGMPGNGYVQPGIPGQSAPASMPGNGMPMSSNGPGAPMNAYPSNPMGNATPGVQTAPGNFAPPMNAPAPGYAPAATQYPSNPPAYAPGGMPGIPAR